MFPQSFPGNPTPILGQTGDTTYQVPVIDPITHALITINYEHHELHEGDSFTSSHAVELTNGQAFDFLIVTPDTTKWAHFVWEMDCELEMAAVLYEGTTASANGTSIPAFNRNRNASGTATTLTFHTPTVAGGAEGTAIINVHVGTGKTAGGEDRGTHEFILKQNTKYLFRATNATISVNWIRLQFDWYEHTSKSA